MYGIFTYIWVIFRANVGKYSIHGAYGIWDTIYSINGYMFIDVTMGYYQLQQDNLDMQQLPMPYCHGTDDLQLSRRIARTPRPGGNYTFQPVFPRNILHSALQIVYSWIQMADLQFPASILPYAI